MEIIDKNEQVHSRLRRNTEEDDTINLKYFEKRILTILPSSTTCWSTCPATSPFSAPSSQPIQTNISNECKGWINNCRHLMGPSDMEDASYCLSANKKRLLGVVTALHQQFGIYPESNECDRGIYYKPNDGNCYCLCTCTPTSDKKSRRTWYFSQRGQLSNIAHNKVVTGVRFVKVNRTIHIQIREGIPGTNDTNSWKPLNKDVDDVEDIPLTYYRRTINLDQLFLPYDYIITGVRFAKADDTTIRLEIQGTKFEFQKNKFVSNDQKWFNSDNASTNIINKPSWLPELHNYGKSKISTYFRASRIDEDFGKTTRPLLYIRGVGTQKIRGLNGIRLSLFNYYGNETIIPQVSANPIKIKILSNDDSTYVNETTDMYDVNANFWQLE